MYIYIFFLKNPFINIRTMQHVNPIIYYASVLFLFVLFLFFIFCMNLLVYLKTYYSICYIYTSTIPTIIPLALDYIICCNDFSDFSLPIYIGNYHDQRLNETGLYYYFIPPFTHPWNSLYYTYTYQSSRIYTIWFSINIYF